MGHLSDEELQQRIEHLAAKLLDGLKREGVVIPPDLPPLGSQALHEWIAAMVHEIDDAGDR